VSLIDSRQWRELCAPFKFKELEIKPQSFSKPSGDRGPSALAAPYFDARAVMARLNEVLGPEEWAAQYEHFVIQTSKGLRSAFRCDISVIRDPASASGFLVTRSGWAEVTDVEPAKGAESASLKRAYSALGNQWLYDIKLGWKACTTRGSGDAVKFSGWTEDAMRAMQSDYEAAIAKLEATASRRALTSLGLWEAAREASKGLSLKDSEVFLADLYYECVKSADEISAVRARIGS